MIGACRWSRPVLTSDDYLSWHRAEVDGRRAEYGVAGPDGPPIVFLHGFALGSHAYKRPLRRLARRGCRVYAPSLPGFGGTAVLPAGLDDLAGYASWVADFIKEMGIIEPAVVIGHSFGGGVTTKLAHSRPDLVSQVVLVNAVGGVSPRPLSEWITGFIREFSSVGATLEMLIAARDDLTANFLRNPIGLVRIAQVAINADVRRELEELPRLGIPALVLTSEGDSVIPRRSFDAVCDFVGSPGHVVSGNHSWLLTDPDAFSAVVSTLVDLQVARREQQRARTKSGEVAALLRRTDIPRAKVRRLLSSAPPLWLTSEPAAVLAGDLALCHPPLVGDEVRAVVHPVEAEGQLRITVVATDRPGLLADSAAVMAANRLNIQSATAATWPDQKLAMHSFVVIGASSIDASMWERLGTDLRSMSATGGLNRSGSVALAAFRPAEVEAYGVGDGQTIVKVRAPDQVGVLARACRWFAERELSIQAVQAGTASGRVDDTFLVTGEVDAVALRRHLERR